MRTAFIPASRWARRASRTTSCAALATMRLPFPRDGASVVMSRVEGSPFSIGGTVSFVNPVDATLVGTATIRAETPAFDQQTFTDGELVTLILDPALPVLQPGFGMIDADARRHGS